MKVNQRKEVIEYILKYGAIYKIGLEVGTKGRAPGSSLFRSA